MILILTVLVHMYWLGRGLLSTIPINQFDGALRLLADQAVWHNFSLYKDIVIVYPPGYAILFGRILSFISSEYRQTLTTGFILLCIIFSTKYLQVYLKTSLEDIRICLYFLLTSLWYQQVTGDAFSLPLTFVLIILIYSGIKSFRTYLWYFILIISGVLVFFRWDFPLFLCFLLGGLSVYEWTVFHSKKILSITIPLIFGTLIGICGVEFYLQLHGALFQGIEAIVTIPAKIILPYRTLPLPIPWHAPRVLNSLLYGSISIWVLSAIYVLKEKKLKIESLFMAFVPFIFLPYATGRADWPHAVPLLSSSILVLIYAYNSMPKLVKLGTIFFALIFLLRLLLPNGQDHISAMRVVQEELTSCSHLVTPLLAASIFVGREQYAQYSYNTATLYFTRPDLKPASSFVSDEPGLQNSCTYGERIASQLQSSNKPMIAYIEQGLQAKEPNASAFMKSCRKIESYVEQAPYEYIGECDAYQQHFEVRLYK